MLRPLVLLVIRRSALDNFHMSDFVIHPQLQNDCIDLGSFDLCRLLLMNDRRYPWCILVPQRSDITEIFQLSTADQIQLNKESIYLSQKLAETFSADKMNIAALGNVVSQLHIHHVVRYKNDQSWPAPIWGVGDAVKYESTNLDQMKTKAEKILISFCARFS